jgi:hypothetical protein
MPEGSSDLSHVHASRVAPCPPACNKGIGSYVRTHAVLRSGWQNEGMKHDELFDRHEAAENLAHEISHWIANKGGVQQDVAALAFLSLLIDAICTTFGEEVSDEFANVVSEFIGRKMAEGGMPNPEEAKFWNLAMDPKLYDPPADIPGEGQTEYSPALLRLLRLEREGKLTPEMQRGITALAREFGWRPPKKKAKAARR